MKVENKEVRGIKESVGYVRGCDNWYIELDMSDWSVSGHAMLSANDCLSASWPSIVIRVGRNCHIFGGGYPTMSEIKSEVASVIALRERARAEFRRGVHHNYFESAEDEGWEMFFKTELQAAGLV